MNLIQHINQPNKLLLAWQPPDGKSRTRFVVGEICFDKGEYVFRYLPKTQDFIDARKEGFVCYPAFRKLTQEEYREGVLDTFLRRILPRKRSDFSKYLEQWRLAPDIDISDFALLGHTGAKLPNDGFSLVNPFENINIPFDFYIEVAGFRHQESISLKDISIGMPVDFVPEPENPKDKQAVRIQVTDKKIGYVNKVQCAAFNKWIKQGVLIPACIERINGTKERPLIYVYGNVINAIEIAKAVA